jgi:hypothetical protein
MRLLLLTLLFVGTVFTKGFAQVTGDVCSYCGNVNGKEKPVQEDLTAGTTYTFKTYQTLKTRSFRLVLATKDAKGNFVPMACSKVKAGACNELVYKPAKNETIYVTYKHRHWSQIFWKTASKVYETDDWKECNPTHVTKSLKSSGNPFNPAIIRKAVAGDAGSSGTATTTIDEK